MGRIYKTFGKIGKVWHSCTSLCSVVGCGLVAAFISCSQYALEALKVHRFHGHFT